MMKGNATMGDKEEGLSSRESFQFERKRERLSILEHLFTTYNTPLFGTKTLDPNARTSPNGMAGLHYVARAARSGGEGAMHDAHLDEKTVDLLVAAGADVNAVDSQTRAGGGGPRYAPLHWALRNSHELAWHLLRVDGAAAHPTTANPPALLLACEEGVEAEMIGYL